MVIRSNWLWSQIESKRLSRNWNWLTLKSRKLKSARICRLKICKIWNLKLIFRVKSTFKIRSRYENIFLRKRLKIFKFNIVFIRSFYGLLLNFYSAWRFDNPFFFYYNIVSLRQKKEGNHAEGFSRKIKSNFW